MASPRPVRIRYLAVICAAACIVSAALGWSAGVLGRLLYGEIPINQSASDFIIPREVGGGFGACSGLLAAALWCRLIMPLSLRQVTGLRSMASLAGLGAGAFAAVLLHGMLMLVQGGFQLKALAVGLGMGAPAGMILGVIAGHLCRIAVTTDRAYRSNGPRTRRIIPTDGPHLTDPMEQLDVRTCPHPRSDFRDEYDA